MVQAGAPVDAVIKGLLPVLDKGDIIIDGINFPFLISNSKLFLLTLKIGGNSHFPDTSRRMKEVEAAGLLFVGTGVSGGEEGALNGPSLMPGGSAKVYF